ncbi:MAG: tRNA dihydrouridine synthase [Candidatus Binatia bacterium]
MLDTPVLAAPIAGFTDAIFRRIVRDLGGCGLMFTEMVGAGTWMLSPRPRPERLEGVEAEPRPLGVQLWDREPEMIYTAAQELAAMGVSVIDLNFGCPKKRIMGKHAAGAALLRDAQTVGRLVNAAVRGAGTVPVTAKIRIGPSLAASTAPDVAHAAEDNGAVAVTVHGRSADQNYDTPCYLDKIAEVVRAVRIPVIANGDIRDADSALRALRETGAAGVMVARGALTRPWVFREITAALRGEPIPPAPAAAEQKALLLRHHAAMVDRYGDPWGTIYMRKFACRYLPAAPGTRAFRDALNRAADAAHFRSMVHDNFPGGRTAVA